MAAPVLYRGTRDELGKLDSRQPPVRGLGGNVTWSYLKSCDAHAFALAFSPPVNGSKTEVPSRSLISQPR